MTGGAVFGTARYRSNWVPITAGAERSCCTVGATSRLFTVYSPEDRTRPTASTVRASGSQAQLPSSPSTDVAGDGTASQVRCGDTSSITVDTLSRWTPLLSPRGAGDAFTCPLRGSSDDGGGAHSSPVRSSIVTPRRYTGLVASVR